MFSRFITRGGKTILIRSAAITTIEDIDDGCEVTWVESDGLHGAKVQGTADENYARLQQEEIALMDAAERRANRARAGLPMQPVLRGRP